MLGDSRPSLDRCGGKSPPVRRYPRSGCLMERGDVACAAASAQRCARYGRLGSDSFPPAEPQSCSTAVPPASSEPTRVGVGWGGNLQDAVPDSALTFSSSKHDEALLDLTWGFQWLLLGCPASVTADFSVAAESSTTGLWEQESAPLQPQRCLLVIMILPEMLAESLCQWNCLW